MFAPSRADVRRFFIDAWRKERSHEMLSPLEVIAVQWMQLHPEYHELLGHPEAAVADFPVEQGQSNPFLHLSMHVALDEQVSIDQPPGIRAVMHQLHQKHGGTHDAQHVAMECLGEVLWRTQRGSLPADPEAINVAYIDCLRRQLG